jgi:NAD+ synthase (glutamine-hydrolysing)
VFHVPKSITRICGQKSCPFGIFALEFDDAVLAAETCEELFTPNSPHILLGLNGVDIITNGSGSHHQLRKLNTRVMLMANATAKGGGAYLYANQQGFDGGRLYFDGCAMIMVNGDCVAQGSQFGVEEVQVVTANVDINAIRSYRAAMCSRGDQAAECKLVERIRVAFSLGSGHKVPSVGKDVKYHTLVDIFVASAQNKTQKHVGPPSCPTPCLREVNFRLE